MCVDIPGVTNQQANEGHADHEVGLDHVLRVAEPLQPCHVLQGQHPVELYLLIRLDNNQESEGEESEVLGGVAVALQVEDVVREEPVLLVLQGDVLPAQEEAGERAPAQVGRPVQTLRHLREVNTIRLSDHFGKTHPCLGKGSFNLLR